MPALSVSAPLVFPVTLTPPQLVTSLPTSLSASGTVVTSGSAQISADPVAGAFSDFGVWDTGTLDPAISCPLSTVSPAGSGWRRAHLTATAPVEHNYGAAGALWNQAAYASVGLRWDNMPAAGRTLFRSVQMERVRSGNLLSADAAFYQNRMLYENGTSSRVARVREHALVGDWSAKVSVRALDPVNGYYPFPSTNCHASLTAAEDQLGLTTSAVLNASVSISTQRAMSWHLVVLIYDANFVKLVETTASTGVFTSAANWGWSQASIKVTAPVNSKWVAVIPVVHHDSLTLVNDYFYSDAHNVSFQSMVPSSAVSDYVPAKELSVAVQAERINLIHNPSFTTNTARWGGWIWSDSPVTFSHDPAVGRTKSGSFLFDAGPGYLSPLANNAGMAGIINLKPQLCTAILDKTSVPYTLSSWVQVPEGYPPVYAIAIESLPSGAASTVIHKGLSSDEVRELRPDLVDGDWVRVWVTWTPGPDQLSRFFGGVGVPIEDYEASALGAKFWADDVLLEQTSELLDYFDGGNPSPDFLWEGSPDLSRSHYYPDRRGLQYRLPQIMPDHVPWGTTAKFLYAQPAKVQ